MNRSYDVRTVALALDMPLKWVDNLLSHHPIPGVARGRQGIGRSISDEGVLAIELVRLLAEFGVGVGRAAAIAQGTVASRAGGELRYATEEGMILVFPAAAIERRLRERMLEAIDAVPRVPRGRPRRS